MSRLTPINTQILDLIGARLANITTANGYAVDVRKIERGRMKPWSGHDLPAINYWPAALSNAEKNHRHDMRTLSVMIEIHSLTRDSAFAEVADWLAGDVLTAINRAPASPKVSDAPSPNLGNTVSDMIFEGYDYEISEGQAPWCGAMVRLSVRYSAPAGNLNSWLPDGVTPTSATNPEQTVRYTPEGGVAVRMVNKSGAASVKGTLAHASDNFDNAFDLVNIGEPDICGIVYDSGVADGSPCWLVVSGIADVFFVGSATRGHFARNCAATDSPKTAGRAIAEAAPTPPFATDKHFLEIGHVIESRVGAGLAKTVIHFN